jgi:ssDNA-binding Zn-finger/Zn-ribbon topoisomerase 1
VTATDQDSAALLEALHAALDADPSDPATRLMLADLLEDTGDRVAAWDQRWQAKHGKWPALVLKPILPGRWRWWDAAYSEQDDPDDIPSEVFRLLPGRENAPVACHYPTRRAAEADLAQALETLASREARLAGYDGEPCPWCGDRKQVSSGREYACDGCGRRWTA